MTHLVLEIGNFRIKGAFFSNNKLEDTFYLYVNEPFEQPLKAMLKSRSFDASLIAAVNAPIETQVISFFEKEKLPFLRLKPKEVKVVLDVAEPEALGPDRIANVYGALNRFPQNDCIVVDLGTAVTFDCISKVGHYIGGAIYPGPAIGAKALAEYTDKLPLITPTKPKSPLGKTTETHIQSGLYWGLLGAIERITDELRLIAPSPSSVKILATGGGTRLDDSSKSPTKMEFVEDLKELVDFIDPHLTLIGLHEILKELLNK